MSKYVYIHAVSTEDAKAKARAVGGLKIDSCRLYQYGKYQSTYQFEKKVYANDDFMM